MTRLTSQQKIAVGLLSFIAIAALSIELYELPQQMKKPFIPKTTQAFKTLDQQEEERLRLLKNSDTDLDGLSDYDEMYIYHTSAYNNDSDSDGIPDGTEVRNGGDPNCPTGKNCRGIPAQTEPTPPPTTDYQPLVTGQTPAPPTTDTAVLQIFTKAFGDLTKLTDADITGKVDQMSSADLRAFLQSIGMPSQAISKNNDATLRRLLKDTITELAAGK